MVVPADTRPIAAGNFKWLDVVTFRGCQAVNRDKANIPPESPGGMWKRRFCVLSRTPADQAPAGKDARKSNVCHFTAPFTTPFSIHFWQNR